MLDSEEGLLTLLINDSSQLVILLLDLLDNLVLYTLLLQHIVLHCGALLEGRSALVQKLFELADLKSTGLLEGHTTTAATMIIEIAVIAESDVMDAAVSGKQVLMLAHADLGLRRLWLCRRHLWG